MSASPPIIDDDDLLDFSMDWARPPEARPAPDDVDFAILFSESAMCYSSGAAAAPAAAAAPSSAAAAAAADSAAAADDAADDAADSAAAAASSTKEQKKQRACMYARNARKKKKVMLDTLEETCSALSEEDARTRVGKATAAKLTAARRAARYKLACRLLENWTSGVTETAPWLEVVTSNVRGDLPDFAHLSHPPKSKPKSKGKSKAKAKAKAKSTPKPEGTGGRGGRKRRRSPPGDRAASPAAGANAPAKSISSVADLVVEAGEMALTLESVSLANRKYRPALRMVASIDESTFGVSAAHEGAEEMSDESTDFALTSFKLSSTNAVVCGGAGEFSVRAMLRCGFKRPGGGSACEPLEPLCREVGDRVTEATDAHRRAANEARGYDGAAPEAASAQVGAEDGVSALGQAAGAAVALAQRSALTRDNAGDLRIFSFELVFDEATLDRQLCAAFGLDRLPRLAPPASSRAAHADVDAWVPDAAEALVATLREAPFTMTAASKHGVEELLGFAPAELLGKPFGLLRGVSKTDQTKMADLPERLAKGVPVSLVLQTLRRDGSTLLAHVAGIPVAGKGRTPPRVLWRIAQLDDSDFGAYSNSALEAISRQCLRLIPEGGMAATWVAAAAAETAVKVGDGQPFALRTGDASAVGGSIALRTIHTSLEAAVAEASGSGVDGRHVLEIIDCLWATWSAVEMRLDQLGQPGALADVAGGAAAAAAASAAAAATSAENATLTVLKRQFDAFFAETRKAPLLQYVLAKLGVSGDLRLSEQRALEQFVWACWKTHQDPQVTALMANAERRMNNKDVTGAVGLYDRVIARDATYAEAWNMRSTAKFMLGQLVPADADAAKTLELEPCHFGAAAGRGLIRMATGDYEAALPHFELAVQAYPALMQRKVGMQLHVCRAAVKAKFT